MKLNNNTPKIKFLAALGASALALTLFCSPLHANGFDIASLFSFGAAKNSADYTFHYAPPSHSSNPNGTPQIMGNRLRGNFVLAKNETDTWSANQKASHSDLSFSPIVGGTGLAVPKSLWDIEAGGIFRRKLRERREIGVNFSLGSASDEPFGGMRETTLKLGAIYNVPSGQNNGWLFSLNYSNNRYFANNIPLPGAAYLFRVPERRFNALIGFPFLAATWQPREKWTSRLSLFGPTNFSAEIGYIIGGPVKIYSGFDWNQQSWLRAGRENFPSRLFYDMKKWSLGIQSPLLHSALIDVSGGYEYGRRFFEAESALKSDIPKVRLAPVWSTQAKLVIFFGTK